MVRLINATREEDKNTVIDFLTRKGLCVTFEIISYNS